MSASMTAKLRIKKEMQEYFRSRSKTRENLNPKTEFSQSMIKDINKNTIDDTIENALKTNTDYGYWLLFDETNILKFQILISGVTDTPYEGGFFHFAAEIPNEYPFEPPKVRFITTNMCTLHYHPNLYKCGKICLSILNTWEGPSWNSSMTIDSVCVSIRSLFSENPLTNEPGYEMLSPSSKTAMIYNKFARYATIKCALINHVKGSTRLPAEFQQVVEAFVYQPKIPGYYTKLVKKYMQIDQEGVKVSVRKRKLHYVEGESDNEPGKKKDKIDLAIEQFVKKTETEKKIKELENFIQGKSKSYDLESDDYEETPEFEDADFEHFGINYLKKQSMGFDWKLLLDEISEFEKV